MQNLDTLLMIFETLEQQKDRRDQDRVAALLEIVQSNMHAINDREVIRKKPQWLLKVRSIVEIIVAPEQLAWMDDENTMSRNQYAIRALSDIGNRSKRCVHPTLVCRSQFKSYSHLLDTSSQGRVALAKKLLELSCAVTHPDSESCPSTPSNKLSTQIMTAYFPIIVQLLNGTEDELSSGVRQTVIDVLVRCMRHHSSGFGSGLLNSIGEVCYRSLKDKARNVRLSAGCASLLN